MISKFHQEDLANDPFVIEVMMWVYIKLATGHEASEALQNGAPSRELHREMAHRARVAADTFADVLKAS